MQYSFMNDYNECAHERILEALMRANREQDGAYGLDTHCARAAERIAARLDGADCAVHFLVGGTQANLTLIAAALKPHQGVIAAETGHISVHETGAIEATGHKVLALPSSDGKLYAEDIARLAAAHYADCNAEHTVQPGLVYISNPTEVGTIYNKKELMELRDVCKRYGMRLYLDGARLGCALVAAGNDVTLADLARLTDAFTIGGTKMGALFGEALVLCDASLEKDFRYFIKQRGGMLAKGRLLGIQFETLFEDDLYFEIARHAVEQAQRLAEGLTARGYRLLAQSPTNQVFPILPRTLLSSLGKRFGYSLWQNIDETCDAVRFCTSWATPPAQVDALLEAIPPRG